MAGIGPMELIVVLVIALVVLGPKRLPQAGRSVGRGMREFKAAISGEAEAADRPTLDREVDAGATTAEAR